MELRIRHFEPGDERTAAALDAQIVADWPWPSADTLEDIQRVVAGPGFNPKHRIYAFAGSDMVGLAYAYHVREDLFGVRQAYVTFPKTLPGYEQAWGPLLDRLIENLREEGIGKVNVWACTPMEGAFGWLEAHGFVENPDSPRGFKKYATYQLAQGALPVPTTHVHDVDEERDREAVAHAVSIWVGRPPQKALEILGEWFEMLETVGHLAVREDGEITAIALISRSRHRRSITAFEYVYAANPDALRQLVSRAVQLCIDADSDSLLVDLIGAHHHFEPTYVDLGFEVVVEHAFYQQQIG